MKCLLYALLAFIAVVLVSGAAPDRRLVEGRRQIADSWSAGQFRREGEGGCRDQSRQRFHMRAQDGLAPKRSENDGIVEKLQRLGNDVIPDPVGGALCVVLTANEAVTAEDITALASLGKLRSLDMSRCAISDRAVEQLARNGELAELNVSSTAVTDDQVKTLAKLLKLHSLNLSNTGVTDAGAVSFKAHPSLREVNLESTGVGNAAIEALSDDEGITSLNVWGTQVDDAGMKYVGKLRHLRKLRVSGVTNDGLADLEPLVELEDFLGLDHLSDDGLYHLRKMTHLVRMPGSMERVSDDGLRSIRGLTRLRELDVGRRVTDEGMEVVGHMRSLELLSLYGAKQITDAGISASW